MLRHGIATVKALAKSELKLPNLMVYLSDTLCVTRMQVSTRKMTVLIL